MDTESLPSLVYTSASPLMESSALATYGDHSDEGLITIPTHDMVWALNNFRHYAPTIESCQQRRAVDWARTQLFIDDHYEQHEDVERYEDEQLAHAGRDIIRYLIHNAGRMVDRVAMEKKEKQDLDQYMLERERMNEEQLCNPEEHLASIYLDEQVIWVANRDQALVDTHIFDPVSVCVSAGARRVHTEPSILPSHHGRFHRDFAPYACQQGIAHCTAAVAEYLNYLNRPDEISMLTNLRSWTKDLLDRGYALVGRLEWIIEITALHEPSYMPIPYLFGHEYAKLRLLGHMFRDHGRVTIANIIDEILQFRFLEVEVILQFLYSGMLGAVNPHPEAVQSSNHPSLRAIITRVEQREDLPEGLITCVLADGLSLRRGAVCPPRCATVALSLLWGFVVRLVPIRDLGTATVYRVTVRDRCLFRLGGNPATGECYGFSFLLALDMIPTQVASRPFRLQKPGDMKILEDDDEYLFYPVEVHDKQGENHQAFTMYK
ncbi:hypothetical protein K438DRAFT_1993143 [Mycena galopus ATCC 62051]|nr:hypothetical protein K438DRAFT_1993143 [Mycena galopus ATCC 62051]